MRYELFLIRHSKTKGNLEGRYIGSKTDEELCEEGIALARERKKELIEAFDKLNNTEKLLLFSSPMKRCIATTNILFSDKKIVTIPEFMEIDFGDFENKNYMELNGNKNYQRWIDSGGKMDYPGGERLDSFIGRTMSGLKKVIAKLQDEATESALVVCHGGNIMAIMSELGIGDYFDFQVKNMEGYRLVVDVRDGDIFVVSHDSI